MTLALMMRHRAYQGVKVKGADGYSLVVADFWVETANR
jgi:hypothetical protein